MRSGQWVVRSESCVMSRESWVHDIPHTPHHTVPNRTAAIGAPVHPFTPFTRSPTLRRFGLHALGGGGANSPPGAKHSPQGRRQSFSQRVMSMAGDWKDHAGEYGIGHWS